CLFLVGLLLSSDRLGRRHNDYDLLLRGVAVEEFHSRFRRFLFALPARSSVFHSPPADAGVSLHHPDAHRDRAVPPEQAPGIMVSPATFLDVDQYTWLVHHRIRRNFCLLGGRPKSISFRGN